jgi:predicted PurR-regulated permease PerM
VTRLVDRRPIRLALLVVLVVALAWLALRLASILTPFAASLALAYFLNPPVNGLERIFDRWISRSPRLRQRIEPRVIAVALLVMAVVSVIVLALVFVVPAAYRQISEAAAKLPAYVENWRARVEPLYERLNLQYPEQSEAIRERLVTAVRENAPSLLAPITHVVQAAFSSVMGFVLTVLNFVVIPVFVVYLLFDMNRILMGFAELVPHRFRPYAYSRAAEVDRLLAAFVRGQITVCLILGVFYALALTACRVPMGLLVGFVIGFFNLIPFMSHLIGLPLALGLSWVDGASTERLVAVAAVFVFGQFVEGNFVTPRVVGDSLGLHAVVIMLAVLVGGTLFGLIGMLVAVPLTAALSVFWNDLRDLYLRSTFFRGDATPPA